MSRCITKGLYLEKSFSQDDKYFETGSMPMAPSRPMNVQCLVDNLLRDV
jgi:hypothetical protein